jgi:hypothetical protein
MDLADSTVKNHLLSTAATTDQRSNINEQSFSQKPLKLKKAIQIQVSDNNAPERNNRNANSLPFSPLIKA